METALEGNSFVRIMRASGKGVGSMWSVLMAMR